MLRFRVGVFPALEISTVKAFGPTVVGVPVIAPVEALRESPGGSVPESTIQFGAEQFVCVRVCEYAVFCTPFNNEVVMIAQGAGADG